jgi:hypothetical protein
MGGKRTTTYFYQKKEAQYEKIHSFIICSNVRTKRDWQAIPAFLRETKCNGTLIAASDRTQP